MVWAYQAKRRQLCKKETDEFCSRQDEKPEGAQEEDRIYKGTEEKSIKGNDV